MSSVPSEDLDIREKLASIDRQLAEHDRRRQEIEYTPRLYRLEVWRIILTAMGSAAAFFAAGAAFMKLLGSS